MLPKEPRPKYITAKEVSEITSVTVQTLANLRFQGQGPPYYKFGRAVRYKLQDVIDFMEANRVEPG